MFSLAPVIQFNWLTSNYVADFGTTGALLLSGREHKVIPKVDLASQIFFLMLNVYVLPLQVFVTPCSDHSTPPGNVFHEASAIFVQISLRVSINYTEWNGSSEMTVLQILVPV